MRLGGLWVVFLGVCAAKKHFPLSPNIPSNEVFYSPVFDWFFFLLGTARVCRRPFVSPHLDDVVICCSFTFVHHCHHNSFSSKNK